MDGLILVDKPRGLTSHDVVFRIRALMAGAKTGHCGTLDPEATGLLLVTVGRATRLFPFLSAHDKAYDGTMRFGFSTDTYDAAGRPTSSGCGDFPDREAILKAMEGFRGSLSQLPPPYSARKQNGRPLYELARRHQDIVLEPREIVVRRFALGSYAPPDAEFEVECSAGTYVRSLVHDLGRGLGCGAHLARLRRTASGTFRLEEALSLEEITARAGAGRLEDLVRPMETLLTEYPALALGPEGVVRARHGNLILPSHVSGGAPEGAFPADPEAVMRLLDERGRLLAFARRSSEGGLSPFLVVADQDGA